MLFRSDTAVFFGLSGTGKTTLSADPNRKLIGDDEHGWTKDSVFNFEGGCYAKCIDLSEEKDLENFEPHWHIIQAPSFKADPAVDGTRAENFAVISFTHKTILIGGTGYTGEMKKGIFTMLNFVLPTKADVLSMHCSANMGDEGDTAVFFGLSGTGKTTLSADPNRKLIGDDEHG